MRIIHGYQALSESLQQPVVTIGNFDGVHLGHQRIIELAIQKARAGGRLAVGYTFRPHPRLALKPGAKIELLTTYDQKLEKLAACGLDAVVEEPFSREFSTFTPEAFFHEVLLKRINASAIVVGYDFAFGGDRKGQLEQLRQLCDRSGVELSVVEPQRVDAEIVSSSRIRQHLLRSEVEIAHQYLGQPFTYRGIVLRGDGRGRKIGFPTANLIPEGQLLLPYGVYATRTLLEGRSVISVTNIGVRPTFAKDSELPPAVVETHLIGESLDLYGSRIEVEFWGFLRPEKRFSGVDELVSQIGQDVESARRLLTKSA